MENSENQNDLINELNKKAAEKLYYIRSLLVFSKTKIGNAAGIAGGTIGNFEEGRTGGYTDKLSALIFFYGYTHKEFYDFEKPLPTERQLKARMKRFHESIGSEAYKIIYDRPDLIDLIEFKLRFTDLFDDWVTAAQVGEYCTKKYGFTYSDTGVPNTLDNAVNKEFLVRHPTASPKAYKRA